MKIKTIEYCKTFSLPNYSNEKLTFHAELEEGDDYNECMNQLRKMAEENFIAANPQIVWEKKLNPNADQTARELGWKTPFHIETDPRGDEKEFPITKTLNASEKKNAEKEFMWAEGKKLTKQAILAATSVKQLEAEKHTTKLYKLEDFYNAKMKELNEKEISNA
jgi:hypothetical protein